MMAPLAVCAARDDTLIRISSRIAKTDPMREQINPIQASRVITAIRVTFFSITVQSTIRRRGIRPIRTIAA